MNEVLKTAIEISKEAKRLRREAENLLHEFKLIIEALNASHGSRTVLKLR